MKATCGWLVAALVPLMLVTALSGEAMAWHVELTAEDGGIMCVNDDDDDANDEVDQFEGQVQIDGEDDLLELTLSRDPPDNNDGSMVLSATEGGIRIKIWTSPLRQEQLELPVTWDSLSFTVPPHHLYVEGLEAGEVTLKLEWINGTDDCEDTVDLKVYKVEFIRQDGEEIEYDGAIVEVHADTLKLVAGYSDQAYDLDEGISTDWGFGFVFPAYSTTVTLPTGLREAEIDTMTLTIVDNETEDEYNDSLTETGADTKVFEGTDFTVTVSPYNDIGAEADSLYVDVEGPVSYGTIVLESDKTSLVFKSLNIYARVQLEDELDSEAPDTITAWVRKSGGDLISEELTETGNDTKIFQNAGVTFVVKLTCDISFSDTKEDSMTVSVTNTGQEVSSEPAALVETGVSSLIFDNFESNEPEEGAYSPADPEIIPDSAKFKLRIYDPTIEEAPFNVTLKGYSNGQEVDSVQVEMVATGDDHVYESSKVLLAYRGDLPEEVKDYFENQGYLLVDAETYEVTHHDKDRNRYTMLLILAYRKKPEGGEWAILQDLESLGKWTSGRYKNHNKFPETFEYDDRVQVHAILRWRNAKGQKAYYHSNEGRSGYPTKAKIKGQVEDLRRYETRKWPVLAFAWKQVEPDYTKSYTSPWAALDYVETDVPDQTERRWKIEVGGDILGKETNRIGTMRYTCSVSYKGKAHKTWSKNDRHTFHNRDDKCISNMVMRICVKGNYTQGSKEFLNVAASYVNVRWIMGSYYWHQAKRRIGGDCADVVAAAYEEWFGSLPSKPKKEPSAGNWLEWAKNNPGRFTIIKGNKKPLVKTVDMLEADLQPGDIVLLGEKHTLGWFTPKHTTVFLKKDGSGKLSAKDTCLMANSNHPGGAKQRFAECTYEDILGGIYEYACVVRVKAPE